MDNKEIYIEESYLKSYKIDFEKVKTLDDVILILKAFNITINGEKYIKDIEHLVKER